MKITDRARFLKIVTKKGKRGKKGSKWVKKRKISKKNSYKLKISHKIRKNRKKNKKIFSGDTPPFYPQKGQNGSKKGKLVKRMVEMGKLDMN